MPRRSFIETTGMASMGTLITRAFTRPAVPEATTESAGTGSVLADWPTLFPSLRQSVNGHPVAYLDTAATSLRPKVVIDALNRRGWPSERKALAAFFQCVLAATLLVYVMGETHPDDWLRTVLIVFFVAIALHRFYWKPSGISEYQLICRPSRIMITRRVMRPRRKEP